MDWVNITLCSNGFSYLAKQGESLIRHNSSSWILLSPEETLSHFSFLSASVQPLYSTAQVFYNFPDQRIDIKLYPKDESQMPGLLITYEPGSPYMDDMAPRGRIPQRP